MADHGQHDQGETPDLNAVLDSARAALQGVRADWVTVPMHLLAELVDAATQHVAPPTQPGDEGRRAAQTQAARDVLMRSGLELGPTGTYAEAAAEVVDAVLAAGGLCGHTTESPLLNHPPLVCTMPAGHAGHWHGDDQGCRWTPHPEAVDVAAGDSGPPGWEGCDRAEAIRQAETNHAELIKWIDQHDARRDERDQARHERDQARADGYRDATTALRDDRKYTRWLAGQAFDAHRNALGPARIERRILADYLEAVGPQREHHHVERRPDGVIAEEHTFARKHLNELVEGTRAIGPSATQSAAGGPTQGEVTTQGRTGADGHTAGRGEAVCTCPRVDVSSFTEEPTAQRYIKGRDPNCPTCGGGRG